MQALTRRKQKGAERGLPRCGADKQEPRSPPALLEQGTTAPGELIPLQPLAVALPSSLKTCPRRFSKRVLAKSKRRRGISALPSGLPHKVGPPLPHALGAGSEHERVAAAPRRPALFPPQLPAASAGRPRRSARGRFELGGQRLPRRDPRKPRSLHHEAAGFP